MAGTDLSQFGLAPWQSSGSVAQGTGTFTPGPPPGPNLNPYRDPGPWGFVTVGGLLLPGVLVSIDGHTKPEEWSVQKGSGSSGATTVWKGTKLAESMKLVFNLFDVDSFDAYYDARDVLRPKLGSKPPSLSIVNAAINFSRITRIACIDVLPPKPTGGLSWLGEVQLIEFNPSKPTNTGPASPAKSATPGGGSAPTANDQAAKDLQKAIDEASKL